MSFTDEPELFKVKLAWKRVLTEFENEMTPTKFERFIKPLEVSGTEENKVKIDAPGHFLAAHVKKHYHEKLTEYLSRELDRAVDLLIVPVTRPLRSPDPKIEIPQPQLVHPSWAEYTFATFVVGPSNRLAVAGAKSVVECPGRKFNPLFIYGDTGVGKTHLLLAIANEFANRGASSPDEPPLKVVFTTAQAFTEKYVNALQNNKIEQFRREVRSADIWLLDDLQLLAGRDKTQEELFHTYNYLQQNSKQMVFVADRPPRELYQHDERLRSRFESGLIADVVAPDTETRIAILKRRAEDESQEVPFEVCEFLSINVPGNTRVLIGAFTKVLAQASFTSVPVTLGLAEEIVRAHYPPETPRRHTFDNLLQEVCTYFDIPRREVLGHSRRAELTRPRHIAIYLCRRLTGASWKRLGEWFGGRDHTSMIHAHRRIAEGLTKDLELKADVDNLLRKLGGDDHSGAGVRVAHAPAPSPGQNLPDSPERA